MKRQHTHQRGVTLFEMLLVLMVMAVVIVSVIQYAQTLREETGAERYGKKLYEYGQAVREYVFDKAAEVRAGDPIPGVTWDDDVDSFSAVGVDWLKPDMAGLNSDGQPYLREDFTFNTGVDPLIVRRVTSDQNPETFNGDEAFVTYVGFEDPTQKNFSALTIKIVAGLLYGDEEGTLVVMPDLSLDAARYASDRYSKSLGVAAFQYDIFADFSKPDEYNPEAEPITGLLSSLGEEDDFLRTDGLNYMKRAISFGDEEDKDTLNLPHGDVGDEDIIGVENIYFDETPDNASEINKIENLHKLDFHEVDTGTIIKNLDMLEFKDNEDTEIVNLSRLLFRPGDTYAGLIYNLQGIVFHGDYKSSIVQLELLRMKDDKVTSIENVDTLDMKGAGRIKDVGQVNFVNGDKIDRMEFRMCNTTDGDRHVLTKLTDGSACFVMRDSAMATCAIVDRTSGLSPNYYLTNNGGGCTFGCFIWQGNAIDGNFCKKKKKLPNGGGGCRNLFNNSKC